MYAVRANLKLLTACLIWLLAGPWAVVAAELPDFASLAERLGPAVVNIGTTYNKEESEDPRMQMPDIPEDSPLRDFLERFFGGIPEGPGMGPGPGRPASSLGSGFIISNDGYVITNYHVVKDADEIIVRLSDRREYEATVVGTDPRSDLAVLKIDADEPLPVLKLGKSENLKVGEWVLAIGSPFGFEHSVTQGIVSAKGRNLPSESYVPFIQTDVAINPGNSGGPLFNLDGEVVGVNSQIYSRTGGFMGLSFAIPIDVVLNVYQQIRDKGEVSRGWLGVLIQDVTRDLAESFSMAKPEGALVAQVVADGPAEKAGLKPGDIVVKFNNRHIASSGDLPPVVGTTPIGKAVPVEIIRAGKSQRLKVTIGELPTEEALASGRMMPAEPEREENRLGIVVRDFSEDELEQQEAPENGVLVTRVEQGPAYDAGIRRGDVIMQIDNKKIKSVSQFDKLVKRLQSGKPVPVLIQRRGAPQFLAMKVPDADEG